MKKGEPTCKGLIPNAATTFNPKSLVVNLTHCPGAYQMIDANGQVIYVGKAKDLRKRVGSYFQGRSLDSKTIAMLRQVADIEVTVTRTETEALMLEYNLIKQYKPRFNVLLRDDKSYPYIHISTDQEFPRLSFYRGSRKKDGRLFGPYPSAGSVRETLSQLQKLFQVRQCDDSYFANRTRPCLQYQIQRCTAPCVGLISTEEYRQNVDNAELFLKGRSGVVTESLAQRMEHASDQLDFELAAQYRDQIAKLKTVESQQLVSRVAGDLDVIGVVFLQNMYSVAVMCFRGGRLLGSRSYFPKSTSKAKMEEVMRAFLLQYYGKRDAPKEILISQSVSDTDAIEDLFTDKANHRVKIKHRVRGDRARWIEMALTNAEHAATLKEKSNTTMTQQLEAVAEALSLDEVPGRLECFDVSHTGGESVVAACVVFGSDGPLKSEYRRFNIAGVIAGDDYGALAQALKRRYERVKKGEGLIPDVLLIDGGKGQLGVAVEALEELQLVGVCLVGVAKGQGRKPGRERLYLKNTQEPLKLAASSPALHLIQQLRDEAHRFAIAGHRVRRQKKLSSSPLEEILGLGPKRRRALLRQFGGLQAVTRASVDDLTQVKGISRQLAQLIYEHFHLD
ncbi:MAG: excinuclease ABC subunit UvrC [Pseudomonadota bacterium]|jgi:excinuclease ABC subunit C|nr:excinuclease ABC subunit UvrC [Pseudomonadota bacterium]